MIVNMKNVKKTHLRYAKYFIGRLINSFTDHGRIHHLYQTIFINISVNYSAYYLPVFTIFMYQIFTFLFRMTLFYILFIIYNILCLYDQQLLQLINSHCIGYLVNSREQSVFSALTE